MKENFIFCINKMSRKIKFDRRVYRHMKIVILHVTIYSFLPTEKKNEVEETRIFKLIYQFCTYYYEDYCRKDGNSYEKDF